MAEKINFTKASIKAIEAPEKGRRYIYDSQVANLCICVTHKGTKTWYRYGRVNGKPQRYRIGRVEQVTVSQARRECLRLNGEIADRKDPMESRRIRQNEKTLFQAFEWVLENHIKPNNKNWKKIEGTYKKHLAHWAGRKISNLNTAEIQELHTKVSGSSGVSAANSSCTLLRRVYRVAVKHGWCVTNPAQDVALKRRPERERFLTEDELVQWFAALETIHRQSTKDFLLICLYTGARRSNVASMRWDEVDFASGVWTIPGSKFKTKRSLGVVLVEQSLNILKRRHKESSSPWVFPGQGGADHYSGPKTAWKRLCEKAGLEDVRPHDLRRTLASWQAIGGSSLPVIGKSLGHQSQATTQIYARLDLDSVRQSVTTAADAIEAASRKNSEETPK